MNDFSIVFVLNAAMVSIYVQLSITNVSNIYAAIPCVVRMMYFVQVLSMPLMKTNENRMMLNLEALE